MSWSVNIVGSPEAIAKELDSESGRKSGQCKVEFDAALPFLKGLILQNFNNYPAPVAYCNGLRLVASGSGSADSDGTQRYRSLSVKLEQLDGKLV